MNDIVVFHELRSVQWLVEQNRLLVPKHPTWDNVLKGKFVDSIITGVPVPALVATRNSVSAVITVVDGENRVNAFLGYIRDEFALPTTQDIHPIIAGRKFSELPVEVREQFLNSNFHVLVWQFNSNNPDHVARINQVCERY